MQIYLPKSALAVASALLDPYPGCLLEWSLKLWRQSSIDYLAIVVWLPHGWAGEEAAPVRQWLGLLDAFH